MDVFEVFGPNFESQNRNSFVFFFTRRNVKSIYKSNIRRNKRGRFQGTITGKLRNRTNGKRDKKGVEVGAVIRVNVRNLISRPRETLLKM